MKGRVPFVLTLGVLGSRITGAGFGGCTVNPVSEAVIPAFAEWVRRCAEDHGTRPSVFVVERILEAGVQ